MIWIYGAGGGGDTSWIRSTDIEANKMISFYTHTQIYYIFKTKNKNKTEKAFSDVHVVCSKVIWFICVNIQQISAEK